MMVSALLVGLALAALFQRTVERAYSVSCIVALAVVHRALFSDISGSDYWFYYLTAILADYLAILLLGLPLHIDVLAVRLQRLALASIFCNGFGLALWYFYVPHAPYDITMWCIYALMLWAAGKRGNADVGGHKLDWGRAWSGRGTRPRHVHNSEHGPQV